MFSLIKHVIRYIANSTGRWRSLYRRFCNPSTEEWAGYLRRWGGLHFVGDNVEINLGCNITDPALVKIGNNVTLSDCTLIGHDGVVRVLGFRFGRKLDSVGPIEIRDNCFIGHGAIVLPRVTIGPDSVVAAGAVVTKDVLPGVVVGGNPARFICTTEQLVAKIEARCASYPWMDIIRQRDSAFDPEVEPTLVDMRVEHYFCSKTGD